MELHGGPDQPPSTPQRIVPLRGLFFLATLPTGPAYEVAEFGGRTLNPVLVAGSLFSCTQPQAVV